MPSPDVYALPPPLPVGGSPEMSGSSGAPNVSSARHGVYSETPNTYSGVAQNVYDAIRNINPPPPTGPGRYSGPTSPTPVVPPYEGPVMSGSHGAPNVYSARRGIYSETPNKYSGVAQSVYDGIRNIYPPPPTGPGRSSGPTPPVPVVPPYSIREGPEYAYTQASGPHPPAYADGPSGATDFSPQLNPPSWPASGYGRTGAPPTMSQQTMNEGKMSVSIDFGELSAPDSLLSAHYRMQGPRSPGWCVKHVVPMNELRIIASRLTGLHESPAAKCSKYRIGRVSSACILLY